MKNVTTFYATRSQARNAAKENGGKLIDHGVDSAPGKRWGVLPGYVVEAMEETKSQREQWEKENAAPRVTLGITVGYRNRKAARTSYVNSVNGAPVPVLVKRSKQAALLSALMARSS